MPRRPVVTGVWVAALLAGAACRHADPWAEVDAVCQWDAFFAEYPPLDQGFHGHDADRPGWPAFPSVDCVEITADQVGLDLDTFEAVTAEAMPDGRYDLLDGPDDEAEYTSAFYKVMTGLRSPFVVDLGTLDMLTPSRLVSEDFVRRLGKEARRLDTDQVDQLAFAYVSRHIRTLRPATPEEIEKNRAAREPGALQRFGHGEVIVYPVGPRYAGLTAFGALTHEARHEAPPRHITLDDATQGDADIHGAYGAALSIHVAALRALPEDMVPEDSPEWFDWLHAVVVLSFDALWQMRSIRSTRDPATGDVLEEIFDRDTAPWGRLDPWQ